MQWVYILVSAKPRQAWARKKRVKKELLSAAGKKSSGVISKVMLSLNKGSMGILFWEPMHINT
jgi:hypothetical protein